MQGLSLAAHIQGRVVRRLFAIEDGSGRDKKSKREQDFKWTAAKREDYFQTSADGLPLPLHTLYLCHKLNVLTSGRACEERERGVVCAARICV